MKSCKILAIDPVQKVFEAIVKDAIDPPGMVQPGVQYEPTPEYQIPKVKKKNQMRGRRRMSRA